MIVNGIIAGSIDPNKIKLKKEELTKINKQVESRLAADP